MFERKSTQNKTYLIRKIVNLKYKDSRPVAEHLNDFQKLVNKLTTLEIKLDNELQSLLLLSSLPDSWETLVVSLSNSAPKGKITLEMVKDNMQNEESRIKEQGITSDGDALITEHRGRNRGKSSDKKRYRSKCRGKVICHYCDKPGHIKRFCKKFKRDQKNVKDEDNREEAGTAAVVFDADVIAVFDENLINFTCSETTWIADTSASFHVTPLIYVFSSYREGSFGSVKVGNDTLCKVVGMGDVWLDTSIGKMLLLKDVRHIAEICSNLISIGVLDEEGYDHSFHGGK